MEIRTPDQTHLPAIFALLQRCFPGVWTDAEIAGRIFYDALYDPNHVWMAREQGRVLGFAASVQDGSEAWLKLLVVDEERRRQGLASDLLSRAEYRLAGEGVRRLSVASTPPREFFPGAETGTPAELFLEARGFRRTGAETALRRSAPGLEAFQGPEPDRVAAAAFGKARCGTHWHWVEDQLSFRPARAVFVPGTGLCLAEPGRSVGPLWPAADARATELKALADAALSLAASLPPPAGASARGLKVWQVPGAADLAGLAGWTVEGSAFHTYAKDLS